MEYTKFDLEQHYERLIIKQSALQDALSALYRDRFRIKERMIDDLKEVIDELDKEMVKTKMEMMIFDIEDSKSKEMEEYIETLKSAIELI